MTDLENFSGGQGRLHLEELSKVTALPLQTLGMRFHHVGMVVQKIQTALNYYVGLFGFEQVLPPAVIETEQIRVCFIRADPGVLIELVEAVGEHSFADAILDPTGKGLGHICYQVDDLDAAVRILSGNKCSPLKRYQMHIQGLQHFALLSAPDGQLFELCEIESDDDDEISS